MGNTACCEQAKLDLGVNQKLEEFSHQKAAHTSEIKEQPEEPYSPPMESHEKVEEKKRSHLVQENKNEIEDILQVEMNDPSNEIIAESVIKVKQEPEPVQIPHLPESVSQVIEKHHFFQEQQQNLDHHRKKYQEDVYVGSLDEEAQRPNGFGKMYKEDGSIYIGHFENGRAHGSGVFIFPNGSFYNGEFKDNKADTVHGVFKSEAVTYNGGFKNNAFHGLGKQEGTNYQFDGEYNKGAKVKGIFKWQALDGAYEYEGSFNSENKFHATGILRQPNGVYEGEFVNGQKHGHGYFRSVSGYRYKGDYTHDARTGKGAIFDSKDELIYEGEVLNGLPHGKGKGLREGKVVESVWDQGIEVQLIS